MVATRSSTSRTRYRIVEFLGRGSFGRVELAHDLKLRKKVAIKFMSVRLLDDNSHIANEFTIMKNLRHPNIIHVFDAFLTNSDFFYTMQFCDKGSLDEYLGNLPGGIDDEESKRFFTQISSAIYFLHRNGVVHRDVKPENIMVDGNTNLKLADFGLAAKMAPNTMVQQLCGTKKYYAPEMLKMLPFNPYCSDIWAMGYILYHFLNDEDPFKSNDHENMKKANFIKPVSTSPGMKLVLRMLTEDPEDRLTIDDVIEHDWLKNDEHMRIAKRPENLKTVDICKQLQIEYVQSSIFEHMENVEKSDERIVENKHKVDEPELKRKRETPELSRNMVAKKKFDDKTITDSSVVFVDQRTPVILRSQKKLSPSSQRVVVVDHNTPATFQNTCSKTGLKLIQ